MTVFHNSHPKKLLDRSSPWRNTEATVACILVMMMAIGGSSLPEHAATCSTRAPTSGKLDEKARYVVQFVIIQWHRAKEIPELAVTTTSTLFDARNFFYKKKTFWSSSEACNGERQADFEWVLSPCQITNHSSKGDYSSWSCTQFMHQKCSCIAILLKGHQLHFVSVALTSCLQEKGRMSRIEPQGSNKINVTWLKTFPVTQTCMSSNLQGRPCFELLSSTFITKTVFVPVMKLAQYFFYYSHARRPAGVNLKQLQLSKK